MSFFGNAPMNSSNPTNPYYEEDEINFLELWNTLWKGKWFIAGFTLICAILSIIYALQQTPIYKAEVLLAPVSEEKSNSGLNSLAGQYGGIAALAGINLGGSSNSVETNIAILKSREFIYHFIRVNGLMPILFKGMWDKENEKWRSKNPGEIPTQWSAYKKFINGILKVNKDKISGLVTLNILWKDPGLAAKWANVLVNNINEHLRLKAIEEAKNSIEYIDAEIAKTSDVTMQEILYKLIEKQMQTITLAQVREQFVFSIIDPAVIPEKKYKPNRRQIIMLGTAGGVFISVIVQFLIVYINNISKRKHKKIGNES
jgi:uncharacterized protein involved in exopolysaccharide biosynthesis